jgi:hypothetical protein
MFQYVFLAIYKRIFHMKHISVLQKYRCTDVQNKAAICKEHTINSMNDFLLVSASSVIQNRSLISDDNP